MPAFSDTKLLRRVAASAAVAQFILILLLYLRGGFPQFGDTMFGNAPAWERPLGILQMPGVLLLRAGGLCCGYDSEFVIGDVISNGHATMSPEGPIILGCANLLVWVPVTYLLILAMRKSRRPVQPGAA